MLCVTKKHKSSSNIILHVTVRVIPHVTAQVTAKTIEIFVVSYQSGQFRHVTAKHILKNILSYF